jgi:hypothetical protein
MYLCALLTGRALEVYSRLSDDEAVDYKTVKRALLDRYNLTAEGYRFRFRSSKPEGAESPRQFIVRLQTTFKKWVDMAEAKSVEQISSLIVEEQFYDSCPKDLVVHLKEQQPKSLDELGELADCYLFAHSRKLSDKPFTSKKTV